MSVVPTFTPVTAPVERSTVATDAFGDTQPTRRPGSALESAPSTVTSGWTVWPTMSVSSAGEILIDFATGGVGAGAPAVDGVGVAVA